MPGFGQALMGSAALFFASPPSAVSELPVRPVSNVISIPAFVTIQQTVPTRFLTLAEQQDFVAALRLSGRVRSVIRLG